MTGDQATRTRIAIATATGLAIDGCSGKSSIMTARIAESFEGVKCAD